MKKTEWSGYGGRGETGSQRKATGGWALSRDGEYSRHVALPTFHCKVSELLLLCASLGGKGHSGAQLWVVKLTGSEQEPFTELYIAYTLKTETHIQSVAEA